MRVTELDLSPVALRAAQPDIHCSNEHRRYFACHQETAACSMTT